MISGRATFRQRTRLPAPSPPHWLRTPTVASAGRRQPSACSGPPRSLRSAMRHCRPASPNVGLSRSGPRPGEATRERMHRLSDALSPRCTRRRVGSPPDPQPPAPSPQDERPRNSRQRQRRYAVLCCRRRGPAAGRAAAPRPTAAQHGPSPGSRSSSQLADDGCLRSKTGEATVACAQQVLLALNTCRYEVEAAAC